MLKSCCARKDLSRCGTSSVWLRTNYECFLRRLFVCLFMKHQMCSSYALLPSLCFPSLLSLVCRLCSGLHICVCLALLHVCLLFSNCPEFCLFFYLAIWILCIWTSACSPIKGLLSLSLHVSGTCICLTNPSNQMEMA